MFTSKIFFSLLFLYFFAWPAGILPVQSAQKPQVKISDPQNGDVLQGVVLIHGTTDVPEFRLTEVSFGYQNDPTTTWFIIEQSKAPVKNDLIASWDTSTITDGEYQLRVKVELADGQMVQEVVTNLRVRNYSPVETGTPDANPAKQIFPTATSLPDYIMDISTPTPLPTNPAQLTVENLQSSAFRGVAYVFAAIGAAAVYFGIRRAIRRL
jgi:hypothetical protein